MKHEESITAEEQNTSELNISSTPDDNIQSEAEIQKQFMHQTTEDAEASVHDVPNGEQALPQQPLPQSNMPPQSQVNPTVISAQPPAMPRMDATEHLGEEQAQNLELIMSVPLEISVEIGRTRKKVKDILAFSKGTLLVLDKLAGDQVDLYVNGQCIAKGDVVVIDDNFGIRVTEILKPVTTENLNL